jgi:hypothetical protein
VDVATTFIKLPEADYVGGHPRDEVHPHEWEVLVVGIRHMHYLWHPFRDLEKGCEMFLGWRMEL